MARLLAAAWRGRALTAENYAAYFRGLLALEEEQMERDIGQYAQVRSRTNFLSHWRQVGPEAGPTSAFLDVLSQECMGQLASFGPT